MPPTVEEEDTIIVNGNHVWSHQSSPSSNDSLSPAGVQSLAKNNIPQHLESPEPLEEEIPSLPNNKPSKRQSKSADQTPRHTKKPKIVVLTMEERLTAMPEKRPLPWRDGVEPGAEIETGGDSRRKQIRFGCLLATRGDVAPEPCASCANGRGKFKVCVALEGYFKGACASCQLSGRPNRCSIKQSDDAELSPKVETPSGGGPPAQEAQRPSSATVQSSGSRSTKRRRTDVVPAPVPVPEWENTRPQWEQEVGDSHPRQQMNIIQPVQRPWATVNAPAPVPTAQPPQFTRNVDVRSPMGWSAVNQPVMPPVSRPLDNSIESNGNIPGRDVEPKRREEPVQNEEGSSALIDRLPKTKQRQVYGLISGLQGGIEHLQRELDSLKKALGIDEEE